MLTLPLATNSSQFRHFAYLISSAITKNSKQVTVKQALALAYSLFAAKVGESVVIGCVELNSDDDSTKEAI